MIAVSIITLFHKLCNFEWRIIEIYMRKYLLKNRSIFHTYDKISELSQTYFNCLADSPCI